MYFPYLRGRKEELLAVLEAAPVLRAHNNVVPIIEPVNNGSKRISRLLDLGFEICIIHNPSKGEFVHPASLPAPIREMFAKQRAIATLRTTPNTTADGIRSFAGRFSRVAFHIAAPPNATALRAIVEVNPTYVIFSDHSEHPSRDMPRDICVRLDDGFRRQAKNQLYGTRPEELTRFHLDEDRRFGHFGDYSIVGNHYPKKGGGQPWSVALHHVFQNGARKSPLIVRHFVSDTGGFAGAAAQKTLEALRKLITFQRTAELLSSDNATPTISKYVELDATSHFPGLGMMKRLAIRHHLELTSTVIQ